MPELPEVETTLNGVKPHLQSQKITLVTVRQARLRWLIPENLAEILQNQKFKGFRRRAKYLIFEFDHGELIIHLGMSGRLSVLPHFVEAQKHDHVDFQLQNGKVLRYTDPRRFGAILWHENKLIAHKLLAHLGPEPLSEEFDLEYLKPLLKKRQLTIKQVIMDAKIVVGVGNIYANEALFLTGIDPRRPANKISAKRVQKLIEMIKNVLHAAIKAGGTTLKDFYGVDGAKGYFVQQLHVYGRAGLPCNTCGKKIKSLMLGQRNTFYCSNCQR